MTTVQAPPSKSVTHRALILAARSDRPVTVEGPLRSRATDATLRCLVQLGTRPAVDEDRIVFTPAPWVPPRGALDCAGSASTLRMLAPSVASHPWPASWTGDARLRGRGHVGLWDALRQGKVRVDGELPATATGPLRPGGYSVQDAGTSQVASGLLLALPYLAGDSVVRLPAGQASRGHLRLTVDVLGRFRIRVTGDGPYAVQGGQEARAHRFIVDGDWSHAAMLWAAAAVARIPLRVTGLDPASHHPDRGVLDVLASMGACVHRHDDGATVDATELHGADIDLRDRPDLFPALCVLAATAEGVSTFTAPHLRRKESDRIAAMAQGLGRLGIRVHEQPAGLTVHGGAWRGGRVDCRGDHRIHMAFACLGRGENVHLPDDRCPQVSWPGFPAALASVAP